MLLRLTCKVRGHDWGDWIPWEGGPVTYLIPPWHQCKRCGKCERADRTVSVPKRYSPAVAWLRLRGYALRDRMRPAWRRCTCHAHRVDGAHATGCAALPDKACFGDQQWVAARGPDTPGRWKKIGS